MHAFSIYQHKDRLNSAIIYDRDYSYDYFGFKTLERAYLIQINKRIVERPQHMIMRVSLGIHKDDIEAALESYDLMSRQYFTHATPTLYNAGTPNPQLSSCFLLTMKEDSIMGQPWMHSSTTMTSSSFLALSAKGNFSMRKAIFSF